jgi:uncharacterized membrane protein
MLYYGLTSLGIFHTIISFIALFTGIFLIARDRKITWDTVPGKVYVITTLIVCVTGFGIFQHGGFGKPHALGVVTLLVFVVIVAAHRNMLGKASPHIEMGAFTLTLFFHFVPTITEGATRLPYGAPLASSPDDPNIQKAILAFLLVFVVIIILQIWNLRKLNYDRSKHTP